MLTTVNQSLSFLSFITPCQLAKYGMYLHLFIFFTWIKNPGWVTDDNGYEDFPEDYQACGQPVDLPCDDGHESLLSFYYSAVMYKTKFFYNSDV